MALPRPLDAEADLGIIIGSGGHRLQFGSGAQNPIDEEAMDHICSGDSHIRVIANELIGDRTGEPRIPTLRIEAQQMLA